MPAMYYVEELRQGSQSWRACEHAGFKKLLVSVANDEVGAVVVGPVLLAQVFKTDGGRACNVRSGCLLGS